MKELRVDLRSRRVPPQWAWIAVACLSVAAIGLAAFAGLSLRELNTLRAEEASLVQRIASPPKAVVPQRPAPVPPYDASARIALEQASAQWPSLLVALESIEMAGVTPVSIDVSVADRRVLVELEFTEFAAVLRFLDELNAGEGSLRWQLVQAQGAGRGPGVAQAPVAALATATIRSSW